MKSDFSDAAVLQTITKDSVKSENIDEFVSLVSKTPKDDLDESISIEAIHSDANLASVFTP